MASRIFDTARPHVGLDNPEQRRGVFSKPRRHRVGFKLSPMPEFIEELFEGFQEACPYKRMTKVPRHVMQVLGEE